MKASPPKRFGTCATIAALIVALSAVPGCGKKPAAAAPTPSPAETNPAPAPGQQPQAANQPAPNLRPPVQPGGQVDLGELNRDLLRWMMRNRRRPANFEDFAATAGVTIPPPPPGKKYIIGKDMRIQLVDRQP